MSAHLSTEAQNPAQSWTTIKRLARELASALQEEGGNWYVQIHPQRSQHPGIYFGVVPLAENDAACGKRG